MANNPDTGGAPGPALAPPTTTTPATSTTQPVPSNTIAAGGSTYVNPQDTFAYGMALTGNGAVPPADSLQKTSKKKADIQETVAAMDAILPVPYGIVQVQPLLANVLTLSNQYWVFWLLWSEGAITSIDTIYNNDVAMTASSGAVFTHYTGTTTQTVNSTLVAAFAGQTTPQTFTLALEGIAYSVLKIPFSQMKSLPKFAVTMHGRKVYDPRLDSTNGGSGSQRLADSSTWAYSNNPSLILADFLTTSPALWGCGNTMLWSSVATCADLNDTVLGQDANQEKSRTCDIVLDKVASITAWKNTLCAAANVFIAENQGVVKLIPDVGGSSSLTFSRNAGNMISMGKPQFPEVYNLPTVVDVTFTDASNLPWVDKIVTVKRPGVDAGTTPFRRSSVPMQWIKSESQATREATERLNKLWLRGIKTTIEVFDEGLQLEVGDIISLDDDEFGFTNLPMKVVGAAPTNKGTWQVQVQKEDAGAYSDVVQIAPSTPNTDLPLPSDPPVVTNLAVVEEVYQLQTGLYASRLRLTWTEPLFPFIGNYQIDILQGDTTITSGTAAVGSPAYVTKPLAENITYNCHVTVRSSTGVLGTATAVSITNSGKSAKPSDVAILNVFPVGGSTQFQWSPATDLDLTGYELRYGAVGGSWSTATLIDRVAVPSLRYVTTSVLPGTWVFYIKALDSVRSIAYPFGQESVNAATSTITISNDPSVFVVNQYAFTSPSLSNLSTVTIPGADPYYLSDYAQTMESIFTGSTLNATFPAIMASYESGGTSELVTEVFDFGATYSGTMSTQGFTYTDISGTAALYTEVSLDNVTWTQFVGVVAQVTARYVRLRINTTGIMKVSALGTVQFAVITLQESGEITTSASAAVTVTLSRAYARYDTIQVTGDGSSGQANPAVLNINLGTDPRFWQSGFGPEDYVDEVDVPVNTFDIKCWDGTNTQVANSVKWLFRGV